jgi:hypothetical protein
LFELVDPLGESHRHRRRIRTPQSLAAYPELVQDENHDFFSGSSSFVIGKAVDTEDKG